MSAAVARTCPVIAGRAALDDFEVKALVLGAVVVGVVAAGATLIQALETQCPSVSWA